MQRRGDPSIRWARFANRRQQPLLRLGNLPNRTNTYRRRSLLEPQRNSTNHRPDAMRITGRTNGDQRLAEYLARRRVSLPTPLFAVLLTGLSVFGCLGSPALARGSSPAAGGLSWSKPVLVDHRAPFGARFALSGVSCP